jgi:cobalt-zinc-cadmium resistance protein CzcA
VGQALQANGTVQAAQGALAAQQALRRTYFDVGRTTIVGTYGQVNSPLSDNVLSISQSLALPGYYRAQAGLSQARTGGREQQLAQVQAELRRQVRLSYERAVHARHRLRTLRGQDSIYAEFLRSAQLRFKTGEVARLEPANALIQQGLTQNLLAQARADYAIACRQLQALLQTAQPVAIADSTLRLLPAPAASADTAALAATPQARVLQQQVAERRAETRVEQAQGLPQVTVGYTNQSLRGTYEIDGQARTYSGGDRFQSVQAGLAVPLLRGPQKARVQAAKLQEQVATANYQRYRAEAAAQLDELRVRLQEQRQRVRFFEQTGLPQAAIIVRLSQRAYKAGETTYSELLLNLERALSVRTAYLDAVLQHNQTTIDLEHLLGTTTP